MKTKVVKPRALTDLLEIVKVIVKHRPKIYIHISSNGFLTQQILDFAKKASNYTSNLEIGISIDGIGTLHDTIRGTRNAFAMALKTLSELKKVEGIKRNINMTILPCNYAQIPEVQKLAADYGTGFGFQIAEIHQFYLNNTNLQGIYWSTPTLNDMENYVRNVLKNSQTRDELFYRSYNQLVLDGKFYHAKNLGKQYIPCFSGFRSLMLDPTGNIRPCLVFDSKMGNIREHPIREIWFSENAQDIRKQIAKGKGPSCWLNCENHVSIFMNPQKLAPYFLRNITKL